MTKIPFCRLQIVGTYIDDYTLITPRHKTHENTPKLSVITGFAKPSNSENSFCVSAVLVLELVVKFLKWVKSFSWFLIGWPLDGATGTGSGAGDGVRGKFSF